MPKHSGVAARIADYVAQHPGCLRRDLLAALGLKPGDAMPTYCASRGLIFCAGQRGTQRYYPTAAEAWAADETVRLEAEQQRRQKVVDGHRRQNLRRRARRAAAGQRLRTTRPGQCIELSPGVQLLPDVRLVVAKKKLGDRFAPAGPAPRVVSSSDARPWAQAYAASLEAA